MSYSSKHKAEYRALTGAAHTHKYFIQGRIQDPHDRESNLHRGAYLLILPGYSLIHLEFYINSP